MRWWEIILVIAGCIAVVIVMLMYPLFVISGDISKEEEKAKVKEKESKDENRQR